MQAQFIGSVVAGGKAGEGVSRRPSFRPLQAWVLLNAFDVLLTWLGLHLGAVEGNAGIAYLVGSLGPERALAIKFMAAVLVGGLVWRASRGGLWKGLNWAMAAVVAWNLLVLGSTL